MNEFIKRWKSDKRFQTKIKLGLYTLFVVIVSIYAISINNSTINQESFKEEKTNINNNPKTIIMPKDYTYNIEININNEVYNYSGEQNNNKKTIIKEHNEEVTNYLYQNNEYYIKEGDIYLKTTKNDIYDIINYNYLNIDNINVYLSKSQKQQDQYIVYLKDILLGNDSEDYFVINIDNNSIDIDYTPLMKEFNKEIEKYLVKINYQEIE